MDLFSPTSPHHQIPLAAVYFIAVNKMPQLETLGQFTLINAKPASFRRHIEFSEA
jgi:hypothetical protein